MKSIRKKYEAYSAQRRLPVDLPRVKAEDALVATCVAITLDSPVGAHRAG